MRLLPLPLVLLTLAAATGCAAADLLADLRAEVASVSATATLSSATLAKGDGGPLYATHNLQLKSPDAVYELAYKCFLPPNEARSQQELNDWSGGLGMVLPSDKGWYSNGFLTVTLTDASGGASTADHCAEAKVVRAAGTTVAADYVWQFPQGQLTARFFLLASRPELFIALTAQPKSPAAHLEVSLQCYPGGFASPFDRWVHTAAQNVQAAPQGQTQVTLDPAREHWMALADHFSGVTARPMGPCSLAVDPRGLVSAKVVITDNYSVRPTLVFAPGQTTALLALREFPLLPWQDVLKEVADTSADALKAAVEALPSLQSSPQ
ncbi:MAG: hypothetical protein WCP21_17455 [Armatimonadota bacterium]